MTKAQPNAYIIYALVAIEGFASIAVEILTLRQVIPFTGSSVIVTSIVIGIFLLFLALGYNVGGFQEKNCHDKLTRNFLIASLLTSIGLSYAFIQFFFNTASTYVTQNELITLTLFCLVITAPLIFLLGQTIPITLNWFQGMRTGLVGGRILFINTVGSFLGSILTSVLLFQWLGIGVTVAIVSLMLLLLAIIAQSLANQPFEGLYRKGGIVFLVLIAAQMNVYYQRSVFTHTNAYANYEVIPNFTYDQTQGKLLLINRSTSSFINPIGQGFRYIEQIKQYLFRDLKLRHANILVLGAGGFSLSAESDFENHFTYVDIDEALKKITLDNLQEHIQGDFVDSDARVYLQHQQKHFDAVVVDVYSHMNNIPEHLLSVEFFLQVREKLNDHGFFVMNAIMNPTMADPYSKSLDNTVRHVFKACSVIPHQYSNALTNVIYLCAKQHDETRNVYNDDRNRSSIDRLA